MKKTHIHYKNENGLPTAIYNSWMAMKKRCSCKTDEHYKNYGGRGIKVCARWLSFGNFLADMGERPANMTLDRIDNNGNYEPSNCRWATVKTQRNNSRQNRYVSFNGITKSLSEWAELTGIKRITIQKRFDAGLPPNKILYRGSLFELR